MPSTNVRRRLGQLLTRSNVELFAELTRANFRTADHNSLLGALWSLLSPFVMLVALWLVFRQRFGSEVEAYPLYLLVGISLVNYFATTTRFLITVLVQNRQLLLNTTVPRETLIASQLAVHGWKLAIEISLCALLSVWYGLFSPASALGALPLLGAYVAFSAGVGMILALAYSFARDVEHIWSLVSRLLLFVTPVFYGLDGLPWAARLLVGWLNPLTPFLVALRSALMAGTPGSPAVYGYALFLGAGVFAIGYAVFLVLEDAALERA